MKLRTPCGTFSASEADTKTINKLRRKYAGELLFDTAYQDGRLTYLVAYFCQREIYRARVTL